MTGLIGVRECSGHDFAKFRNIAHVNAPHSWIKRESPADGSLCQLSRSKNAHKILVVHRRDDKRMIRKPRVLDHPIYLRLAGKVGNVELASADRFHIRQRGPDKVFDTSILRGAYRSGCLLAFVGTFLPKISD